jgi:hypothetical protein
MASNPESLNGNAANAPAKPYHVVRASEDGEPMFDTLESFSDTAAAQTRAKEKSLANDETYVILEVMMVIKPIRQAAVIYSRRG